MNSAFPPPFEFTGCYPTNYAYPIRHENFIDAVLTFTRIPDLGMNSDEANVWVEVMVAIIVKDVLEDKIPIPRLVRQITKHAVALADDFPELVKDKACAKINVLLEANGVPAEIRKLLVDDVIRKVRVAT